MTERASGGVSRRGFLLGLAAGCLAGAGKRVAAVPLEDARIRRMAVWAG